MGVFGVFQGLEEAGEQHGGGTRWRTMGATLRPQ
jgi:hypothetical protein